MRREYDEMPCKYSLVEVKKFAQSALADQEKERQERKKKPEAKSKKVQEPQSQKVYFTATSKSTESVIEVFRRKGNFMSPPDAQKYILNGILELSDKDFFKREVGQWDARLVTDQYGIKKDGIPWFIKFLIGKDELENECLEQISFHPTTVDMLLESGITISKKLDK